MAGEGTGLALWIAVVASGLYHGLNPGMGWPLAVSAALMEQRPQALLGALGALAAGHALAMAAMLLPFGMLTGLIAWQREIAIGAAVIVLAFGLYLLASPRHPRVLARIPPTRIVLWSFAVAMAHGAGLMLVPIYLGLCTASDLSAMGLGPGAASLADNLALALGVSAVHTAAMVAAGGAMAWAAYRVFGLRLVAQSWFNTDALWAASLVLVGAVSLAVLLL